MTGYGESTARTKWQGMPVLDAAAKNVSPTDTANKGFDFRCDLLTPNPLSGKSERQRRESSQDKSARFGPTRRWR